MGYFSSFFPYPYFGPYFQTESGALSTDRMELPVDHSSLQYDENDNDLLFIFPVEWDRQNVDAVSLQISDKSGNVLLYSESLGLYPRTSIDGDVVRFASSLLLDSEATELVPGDPIMLVGSEGIEVHTVKGYDPSTYTVEIEGTLENKYADGDYVYGLFGTISVDTSDTTVYTSGLELVLVWTPTGAGFPITELSRILTTSVNIQGFQRQFKSIYPRAYNALSVPTDRLSDFVEIAKSHIRIELRSHNLDMAKIVDQNMLAPCLMAKVAVLWTMDLDNYKIDEHEKYTTEYERQIGFLVGDPIWIDQNLDLIEDDNEISSHKSFINNKTW